MISAWTSGRRRYVDGLWGQVHLREWGFGRPLLLLHQTPWSGVQFHRLAPLLAQTGWRVIAPDTPGYGLSDRPSAPPAIGDYAENIAVVFESLDVQDAVIAGHHTGALIAAAFAAARPDRTSGLILDNPPFYTAEERAQRLALPHHAQAPEEGGGHFTSRWRFMRGMADPDLSVAGLHLAIIAHQVNDASADHGHAAAYAWDMASAVDAISAPTLVLSSRGDAIHSHGSRLLKCRPDWRGAVLPAGPATALESPEVWRDAVLSFLSALDATIPPLGR